MKDTFYKIDRAIEDHIVNKLTLKVRNSYVIKDIKSNRNDETLLKHVIKNQTVLVYHKEGGIRNFLSRRGLEYKALLEFMRSKTNGYFNRGFFVGILKKKLNEKIIAFVKHYIEEQKREEV